MSDRYIRIRTIVQGIQHILEERAQTDLDFWHSLSLASQDKQGSLTNRELLTTVLRYLQENQDQTYIVYLEPPVISLDPTELRQGRTLVTT